MVQKSRVQQLRLVVYPCLSHYLKGFIHPRWLFGISSIKSRLSDFEKPRTLHQFYQPNWTCASFKQTKSIFLTCGSGTKTKTMLAMTLPVRKLWGLQCDWYCNFQFFWDSVYSVWFNKLCYFTMFLWLVEQLMCMTCHGSSQDAFDQRDRRTPREQGVIRPLRPSKSLHSMEINTTNGHKLIPKILLLTFAVGEPSLQFLSVPLLGFHHPFHWHVFFLYSLWDVCEILPSDSVPVWIT